MSTQLELQPVDTSFSLKEHIYRTLKASIMELDIYDPETSLRMDERRLAERLGISRTPVREALMRLEQEGFVETRARRGVYIRRKSLTEILEMITVWAALESMAARLACAEASDIEIAELRRIGGGYTPDEATAHIHEYSETNIDFHLCILRLSKCRMLQEIAEGLFTHLKAVRRKGTKDTARAGQSVVDHMHIIEAVEERNADLASDLVRDHTMRLREYIRGSWKHIAGETAA
jgi:DNA-binding GntR family transcriptional regulator